MLSLILIAGSTAGVISSLSPLVARPLLRRIGVVDTPNERSSHSIETLRGGGVAPLLGITAGGLIAATVIKSPPDLTILFSIIIVAALTAFVGFIEDVVGLRVFVRAGLQLILGVALSYFLVTSMGMDWWWAPSAILAFVSYVNFTNFMDGVNGISSLHGFIVGSIFSFFGIIANSLWLSTLGAVIALAFLAFLPWNILGNGLFLGDVGSYLLGASIVSVAIGATLIGIPPLASLAPLSIYLADTISTLVRRLCRGEPLFKAHRTHVYQRLTDTGLSHLATASITAAFSLMSGFVGVLLVVGHLSGLVSTIFIALLASLYLMLPRLRGNKLPRANENPLAPSKSLPPVRSTGDWKPKRWVVLGATGFVGSALVKHLQDARYDVVSIRAPRLELSPYTSDGAEVANHAREHVVVRELTDALQDADVVVNAAGLAAPDGAATLALYGANSLLPAVIAIACAEAGVGRLIHLSSAAVQGRRPLLDSAPDVAPFSPYSRSKALGESALAAVIEGFMSDRFFGAVIVRATSVQGSGRRTTHNLQRMARSPLASVARGDDRPTVVSSLGGLVDFVEAIGIHTNNLPGILLQPWEGLSAREVLELAGGRTPMALPVSLCKGVVYAGNAASKMVPRLAGPVRRLELMWLGQGQEKLPLGTPTAQGGTLRHVLVDDQRR